MRMGSRFFTTEDIISVALRLSVVTSSVFIKCYFSAPSKEMQIKLALNRGKAQGAEIISADRKTRSLDIEDEFLNS